MLERGDLSSGGGEVHLLLGTVELLAEIGDVGLFAAAESLLFGDGVAELYELGFGSLRTGLGGGQGPGEGSDVVMLAAEFVVQRLKVDEFGEVGVHAEAPVRGRNR